MAKIKRKETCTSDLDNMIELLLARKTQVLAEIAELEYTSDKIVERYSAFTEGKLKKSQAAHLENNYVRMSGHVTKKEAELRGELTELNGLIRAIPLRREKTDISLKRVRKLIKSADLQLKSKDLLDKLHTQEGAEIFGCTDCITACTECVTACTECVTSCNGDCISCSSDCVGACTSCSPSGIEGCLDTFGMQSLFERKEKVFNPESLRHLDKDAIDRISRLEINW